MSGSGTVLANEEVIDGKSERGNHPVIRKPMRQWMLKITEYAERLLADLETLDWSEGIKEMQRNWIGKSEGAEVDFEIATDNKVLPRVTVYTTRPDTLFGATYMVLSPEHPLVDQITTEAQREAVKRYQEASSRKSDMDRTELATEKTGVFTGAYAVNPVTGNKLPIWIADYVLISYGTGAIMAVPAHDTRDFEFAQKFNIPIVCIIEPDAQEAAAEKVAVADVLAGKACWTGNGKMIRSANEQGLDINGMEVQDSKRATIEWLAARGVAPSMQRCCDGSSHERHARPEVSRSQGSSCQDVPETQGERLDCGNPVGAVHGPWRLRPCHLRGPRSVTPMGCRGHDALERSSPARCPP